MLVTGVVCEGGGARVLHITVSMFTYSLYYNAQVFAANIDEAARNSLEGNVVIDSRFKY